MNNRICRFDDPSVYFNEKTKQWEKRKRIGGVALHPSQVGNPARKLVLLKLADHANDEGICWPSYESIAKQCEISKRTVIRHIAELEKQGLVQVFQRERNGHHHNQSNKYVLRLSNSQSLSPNPNTKQPKNDGDNLVSDGDTSFAHN
ncbi:hypothetical protein CBG25_09785 [Arsenophonus sp. ENCA]|nr:hypothetical protein CBG25_09785 [Arsenophonus sp. ENCA]